MALTMGRANLDVFGEILLELGRSNPNLLVVTSDSRGSGKLKPFGEQLPEQIIEVGIAEQNLVGVAAGLAGAGKTVFAVSPASFLTARALEQIKNDVAYADFPVKLVGISAGVSYGALGSTHHSLHDYAALQAIHNLTIVAPADNFETRAAIRAAVDYPHPLYLRFGKRSLPDLHAPGTPFEFGRAITLTTGSDLTFIAIGETVGRALLASQQLAQEGISAGVISMHTLKPIDRAAVLEAATRSGAILTVEEHSVFGGLGATCASILMEAGVHCSFGIVALPDEYTVTGSQDEILAHYGITPEGLAERGRALVRSGRELAR